VIEYKKYILLRGEKALFAQSTQKRYKYTMNETMNVAKEAAIAIEHYLNNLPETVNTINVEDDPLYQKKDIDLLYFFKNQHKVKKRTSIEIKGDRHYYTGNYFFETHSNVQKNTPGCFMYTEADFLFYYYINEKELHILPMKETRAWFLAHMHEFKTRGTSTQIGFQNKKGYRTSGKLVPRNYLLKSVPSARVVQL